jgi:DNA modification methylase
MVALQMQRNFIGFELNPEYIKIANTYRLANVQQRIV